MRFPAYCGWHKYNKSLFFRKNRMLVFKEHLLLNKSTLRTRGPSLMRSLPQGLRQSQLLSLKSQLDGIDMKCTLYIYI